MKHRWLRRILILLAAFALCAGMVFYTRERPQPKAECLTLWYTESDFSPAVMDGLLAQCLKETGLQLTATAFPDEVSLGEAFEDSAPDLLFCSHIRAAQLDSRESLASISKALPVPDSLSEVRPSVGSSFFPIGYSLPVLLVNTALTAGNFDSPEAMLNASANGPVLVCGQRAELLHTLASANGIRLSGIPDQDRADPKTAAPYNQMALAVFHGTLVFRENAVEYVRQGLVPAAVTVSTALANLTGENLEVQLFPLPKGAERQYPAELFGFALLEGANTKAAADFFQWLWNGRGAETALKAGLAPALSANAANRSSSSFEKLLISAAEGGALSLPDMDDPFFRNRHSCDQWLCEALDLLT